MGHQQRRTVRQPALCAIGLSGLRVRRAPVAAICRHHCDVSNYTIRCKKKISTPIWNPCNSKPNLIMASIAQTCRIARAGIAAPARSTSRQAAVRQARPSVRTAALKQPPAGVKEEEVQVSAAPAAAPASSGKAPPPMINVIPENGVWENGIPPVMGGHLMASGNICNAGPLLSPYPSLFFPHGTVGKDDLEAVLEGLEGQEVVHGLSAALPQSCPSLRQQLCLLPSSAFLNDSGIAPYSYRHCCTHLHFIRCWHWH